MATEYEIHPRIGVARLGNSPHAFYLAPEQVGGLPIECDRWGVPQRGDDGRILHTKHFKDGVGRVKRQAAKFRIFKRSEAGLEAITLSDVKKITWTAHIANKKPIWFTFSELLGDLEFGEANSYENQHVPLNNADVTGSARKALMIDPGPRSVDAPETRAEFSRYTIPDDYTYGSFPPPGSGGQQIDSLGELRMGPDGSLIALGAFGKVTGQGDIASFRGANGYWDDISDGYVLATIELEDGSTVDAQPAWLLVGSPKFAPELVNITTLYDTQYDVGVRFLQANPQLYAPGQYSADSFPRYGDYVPFRGFNPAYKVDYDTQIKPIIDRIAGYRWVADIPYVNDFAHPGFDLSGGTQAQRQRYFSFFRVPVLPEAYHPAIHEVPNGPNQLFSSAGIPLMPLNSGDNSVTNSGPIYKFETLSLTQYFFLYQWAEGHFDCGGSTPPDAAAALDEASVGNCVGAPFSPGIETTWIVRNAPIYERPFQIKLAHFEGRNRVTQLYYRENGLSTTADEAEGLGCEPGDLTKRMAIPWQSDFQECTVQTPNITNPHVNQFADGTGIEVPPAYYVYWWPPQSPMHVITGSLDRGDQVLDGIVSQIDGQPIIPAGQRVPYQRGVLTIEDMIQSWSRLGFIVNQGPPDYPYFVEVERDSRSFGQLAAMQQAQRIAAVQNK